MRVVASIFALAVGLAAGCHPMKAAPLEPPPVEPTATPAAATPPADDAALAPWRARLAPGATLDRPAAELVPELEGFLASPDPERRDRLAYSLLSTWLLADGLLDDAAVAGLRDRLVARTAAAPTPGDAVYGRSFAALVLSVVAAREVTQPVWTDAVLAAQVAAAGAYAGREVDLRGYTGAGGWAHAAAHTADWLKFLARHPRLSPAQAGQILDALAALVTRRHGARFAHGEDERLAAAARAVLRRGLVADAALDAWLARLGEPLAAGWPEPFDATLYAAQRNSRDLLVSLFVALSFDDAAPAAAALARLRAFMAR